jgi:hypothetical protein
MIARAGPLQSLSSSEMLEQHASELGIQTIPFQEMVYLIR